MNAPQIDHEAELADEIAKCYADPLRHVMISYPWGEGPLQGFDGPDVWAVGFLNELGQEIAARGFNGVDAVDPIRFSTASGHGIGKSAMAAWIIRFLMDTRTQCKGVVSANTREQLRTKTWAELSKWHNLALTKHWFNLNAGSGQSLNYYHKEYPATWRVDAQTCEETNSEAFAGLHNASSTAFYLFDEASAIPDKIFEVREGGLTDGEPMVFDFGNPTRNSGAFYQNMEGRTRHLYRRRSIDSRDVKITNKRLIQQWIDTHGIDSDFVKVRVLGQFPSASSLQLISRELVRTCMELDDPVVTPVDPLIVGVDVARFGDDRSVIYTRHGRDARTHAPKIFEGIDTMTLADRVVEHAQKHRPDAVLIDGGGVGAGVVDRVQRLGVEVIEINFGAKPTLKGYANMRSQMWGRMRDAMKQGISLPDDPDLETDLISLEYGYNNKMDLLLEKKEDAKKRGIASPDLADALALTYAVPVFPNRAGYDNKQAHMSEHDYDPMADV